MQIATVQLRAGNVAGAQQTAATIREREAKSEILRQIVAISAARGELARARDMLRDIDDPFYQALAAGDIAVAEVRAGRNDRAERDGLRACVAPTGHRSTAASRSRARTRATSTARSRRCRRSMTICIAP